MLSMDHLYVETMVPPVKDHLPLATGCHKMSSVDHLHMEAKLLPVTGCHNMSSIDHLHVETRVLLMKDYLHLAIGCLKMPSVDHLHVET